MISTSEQLTLPVDYFDHDDGTNVCFHCGAPRYELVHEVKHFDFPFSFYQCGCGLVKQAPMPNERFFKWFFNSDVFFSSKRKQKRHIWGYYDYFADEANRLATSRLRYRKLKHWFAGGPKQVMKIGPATGTFLHVAQQHGHAVRGCDVSAQFIQHARQHYGVTIDHGRFEQQPYGDQQFDIVMLLNVIENVPNLKEFLAAIHRTLKPGGAFILNFVDMQNNLIASMQDSRYFLYRPPVCYIFTMPVLRRVLDQAGFTIAEIHRDFRIVNLDKILSLLNLRTLQKACQVLRINRWALPVYAYPSRIIVAQRK
jgi:ubiquinone/menaquinone biosynthesis C-methylase UbiE